MVCLADELANLLSDQNGILSAKRKPEAMKMMDELGQAVRNTGVVDNMEATKNLFTVMEQYISRTRPAVSLDQSYVVEPVVSKCLTLVTVMIEENEEAREYIRHETGMLATLTFTLKDKYCEEGQIQILQTIEAMSKELKVTWSAPYITQLIKQMFTFIKSVDPSSVTHLVCLRIVTNLVFNNHTCLNMAVRDHNYGDVVKVLLAVMSGNNNPESKVMAAHFVYLTEQSIGFNPRLRVKDICSALLHILDKVTPNSNADQLRNIAVSIAYMTSYLISILARIAKENVEDLIESEGLSQAPDDGQSTRSVINSVVRNTTKVIMTLSETRQAVLRSKFGQGCVGSLLELVKACYPTNLPTSVYDSCVLEMLLKCLDMVGSLANRQLNFQTSAVLDTYLHFVDRIVVGNHQLLPDEIFQKAVNNCQLEVSATPHYLARNILTIRLLSRLGTLTKHTERVKELLNEEVLSNLLNCMLESKGEIPPVTAPSLLQSTCIVETLNVLSKLSKSAANLMGSVQKEETWVHISNCIINGNETLIAQALSLTGTVGFTGKCCSGVSKMILNMRDASLKPDVPALSESPLKMSDKAILGMKQLNENLEMLTGNPNERGNVAIEDILAWYKLKSDMHEMEMVNMTEHVSQLHRNVTLLKTLLNRQQDLISKRAASSEVMQKDHRNILQQLESLKERKNEVEVKHGKAMGALREQLQYYENLVKAKGGELAKLKQDVKSLNEKCSKLEAARDEAIDAGRNLNAETVTLKEKLEEKEKESKTHRQKINSLEKDLKKSEEARKASDAMLEAERRKTEIIQQVLGNRLT